MHADATQLAPRPTQTPPQLPKNDEFSGKSNNINILSTQPTHKQLNQNELAPNSAGGGGESTPPALPLPNPSFAVDLASQHVAVTGASGFIGMQTLRSLHREGAVVTAIVAGRPTEKIQTLGFPVDLIVLEDPEAVPEVIRRITPRFVVHLDAHISTDRSMQALEQTVSRNLLPTIALLTACSEAKVERVILMGSCEEYGQHISPFDTALATDPNSPYGASKAAITAYARMFTTNFKLPTVVLRPSVVYGPGQSQRMLISQVMKAIAEGRSIDVTPGEQTRDFIYVDDVADAILLALVAEGVEGRAWNVGSNEVVTVRECLQRIERIVGSTGLIHYGGRPYPDREIYRYELLNDATYEAFHWRPAISLDEGLRRTWQFISANAHQVPAPVSS